MDAIILCGGLGSRIRTITKDSFPKAMIEILGKTILEWELNWLRKHEIKHAILAVRYLADYIEEQYGKTYSTDYGEINISYSKEKEKLGSGGAVKLAKSFVSSSNCIIMNGDILTNFNLKEMINDFEVDSLKGSIATAKMQSPFGIVESDKENIIMRFREKPFLEHWIHAGVDIFESSILEKFPDKGQMEETIFVELAENRRLKSFQISSEFYWRSIDTPKDFQEAEKDWNG
jgi:NDP-sugar pyrophosphorylase family protein